MFLTTNNYHACVLMDPEFRREYGESDEEVDVTNWDILIENSTHDGQNRYWFKQNFINPNDKKDFIIIYH